MQVLRATRRIQPGRSDGHAVLAAWVVQYCRTPHTRPCTTAASISGSIKEGHSSGGDRSIGQSLESQNQVERFYAERGMSSATPLGRKGSR